MNAINLKASRTLLSLAISATLGLSGCAHMNMGTSSYYQPNPTATGNATGGTNECQMLVEDGKTPNGLLKRFYSPTDVNAANRISKGEDLLVSLQYAQFVNLSENEERELLGSEASAEVAILANVSEYDGNVDHSETGLNDARVVFFSEGIRIEGQPMNFTSVPIYGPLKYNGGLVKLQLYVIEQDTKESKQLAALMKQLASLGTVAYPPGAAQLKLLDQVGGALITAGGKDDKEFYHLMFLYPPSTRHVSLPQSTLRVGNFVLLKDDHPSAFSDDYDPVRDRGQTEGQVPENDHTGYCLNSGDGRLYREKKTGPKNTDPKKYELVRDKSYLTIQVNSGYPQIAAAMEKRQTFAQLMDNQQDLIDADANTFADTIKSALKEASQSNAYQDYLALLRAASDAKTRMAQFEAQIDVENRAIDAANNVAAKEDAAKAPDAAISRCAQARLNGEQAETEFHSAASRVISSLKLEPNTMSDSQKENAMSELLKIVPANARANALDDSKLDDTLKTLLTPKPWTACKSQ